MTIQCFWLDRTMTVHLSLRRFRSSDDKQTVCPAMPGEHSYHTVQTPLYRVPYRVKNHDNGHESIDYSPYTEARYAKDDPRWPTHCTCGYAFADADAWQLFDEEVYQRADTGELISVRDIPAGGLYDAWWYGTYGAGWANPDRPDALNVVCQTPDGPWHVDGKSSQGRFWSRSGDPRAEPPTITVMPSIFMRPPSGYHGWLRDGKLIDA